MNAVAWTLVALPVIVGGFAYVLYPGILWLAARGRAYQIGRASCRERVSLVV